MRHTQKKQARVPLPLGHTEVVPFVSRWAYLLWRLYSRRAPVEWTISDSPTKPLPDILPSPKASPNTLLGYALYRACLMAELCFARCLEAYVHLPVELIEADEVSSPRRYLRLPSTFRYSSWRPEKTLFGMLNEFWQTISEAWTACQQHGWTIPHSEAEPSQRFQQQLEQWAGEQLSQWSAYFCVPGFAWHAEQERLEDSLREHPVGQFRLWCERLFRCMAQWNATPYRLKELLPKAAEMIDLFGELTELIAIRCQREMEETDAGQGVIHRIYRQGEWRGVPWQDVQPYQLLARLIYLRGVAHDGFLEALEHGRPLLGIRGCFDPRTWLSGIPPRAGRRKFLVQPEEALERGAQESWWVGLFFYQLPEEWYLGIRSSGENHEVHPLLQLAPFLQAVWNTWFDWEIVLSGYADCFYPAVVAGWSEQHRQRLEVLAQDYLRDYKVPMWWAKLKATDELPFGMRSPSREGEVDYALKAIENAFSWLVKFVSVPYEAWSLHWVLLEVMSVSHRLQRGWLDWLRSQ
ncbi:MAG: hypothetical protein KatS3mg054_1078 [Chloroflexus sp.]|nr:MAG: hypothetical protein KatS3mg054_1078 [Chloroflexus sp.]